MAASRLGLQGFGEAGSPAPVTVVTDDDYRCVWRPCEALEEPEAPAVDGESDAGGNEEGGEKAASEAASEAGGTGAGATRVEAPGVRRRV